MAGGAPTIRPAAVADYAAFARLFPELEIDDPVPGPALWASALVPFSRVATDGGEILGYCFTQEYVDAGYVRNVVVAPAARRRGVGRALMEATARHLRAVGKTEWRLNVGPTNTAARALYASLGLRQLYASTAVCVPWSCARAFAPSTSIALELPPSRDAEVEALFSLPRGQLAGQRAASRTALVAADDAAAPCLGLAVFSPELPGAFPFRALAPDAVAPLLEAMRARAPDRPSVNLVVDDDAPLLRRFVAEGGEVRGEFLHLRGAL